MRILNANYRIWKDNKKQTVPAPVDKDTPTVDWWYDHIARNAAQYKKLGFTHILLPPPTKTQGGHSNDADGYGKFDDYDIGSKDQSFGIPTRFGTAYQLRRCVAVCHAVGLSVLTDIVLHQYDGGRAGVYQYKSSTGKTNGRFPKTPSCFVGDAPRVPVDDVFDMEGNYAFGDMCSYQHSLPKDYMKNNAILATRWLLETTGCDGMRVDDTKGMNVEFVHSLVTAKVIRDKWCFGECFDGNPDTLHYWVNDSGMQRTCSTIDFTVHWHLQSVCDNSGPASDLLRYGSSYFRRDPMKAVTYVESPDTDLSPGQQIIGNKGLAYWFILTSEGAPLIYYRDWSSDANCYNLGKLINNLLWVHGNLAFGSTVNRHGDDKVCCFERMGYPGLLSAGNWDTWNERTITVQTNFGPNCHLHDYTGHTDDVWTDSQGKVTVRLPSNAFGKGASYVCLSRAGQGDPFKVEPRSTTQTFYGAADLDLRPAFPGIVTEIEKIYVAEGSVIAIHELTGNKTLHFDIVMPNGSAQNFESGSIIANGTGDYTLRVTAKETNTDPAPYALSVSYTAPEGLL
jgi:alpha-amylase